MTLGDLIESNNIADDLKAEELKKIGAKCNEDYEYDKSTRVDWEKRNESMLKLAMQIKTDKSYPFGKLSANVMYPLISVAAIQFAARTYPVLVPGKDIVKVTVTGEDRDGKKTQRATRVGTHMSYQLLEEMEEWEDETDSMLHILPVIGMCFKKTYFDEERGRNVSELVLPNDLIVEYYAKDLKTRVTQEFDLTKNRMTEKIRAGIYINAELGDPPNPEDDTTQPQQNKMVQPPANDATPFKMLEQHCLLDLDEDDYKEPYIVTFEKSSGKVVRIEPRFGVESIRYNDDGQVSKIIPDAFYTKIPFIPAMDGSFYDIGFGQLLGPMNESVNTTVNQLLDAGHKANLGGGFLSRGIKMKGGAWKFKMGEWKFTEARGEDLQKGIFPLPVSEPSNVLFSLLGLMIEAGEKMSSMTDPLTGKSPGTHVPATSTLALIDQGMKVFNGIGKRLHRSFKQELRKLYKLNRDYLNPDKYFSIVDPQLQNPNDAMLQVLKDTDYSPDETDIQPYSDPTMISEGAKMAKAEALKEFVGDPELNGREIKRRYFEAIGIEDIEELWNPDPKPDPEQVAKAAEMEIENMKVKIRLFEAKYKARKADAEAMAIHNKTEMETSNQEEAEAAQIYLQRTEEVERTADETTNERRDEGMEGAPPNEGAPS